MSVLELDDFLHEGESIETLTFGTSHSVAGHDDAAEHDTTCNYDNEEAAAYDAGVDYYEEEPYDEDYGDDQPYLDDHDEEEEELSRDISFDTIPEYVRPEKTEPRVDTEEAVKAMLLDIVSTDRPSPRIAMDLEGMDLGRSGTITLMSIHIEHFNKTYLVDIHVLQMAAFTTGIQVKLVQATSDDPAEETITLQTVLESQRWPKLFWDIRTDSNALFYLYGIKLDGIVDVQLRENLQFDSYWDEDYPAKGRLLGLGVAIERYGNLEEAELNEFTALKESFKKDFSIFSQRPLTDEAAKYATNDVEYLPRLFDTFEAILKRQDEMMAVIEEGNRLRLSQSDAFVPGSKANVYAPDWAAYRTAYDPSDVWRLGWTGKRAVCDGSCLTKWGHAHICEGRCPCYGVCEVRRKEIEDKVAAMEARTFPGYWPGDLHLYQKRALDDEKKAREERLKQTCRKCGESSDKEEEEDGSQDVAADE